MLRHYVPNLVEPATGESFSLYLPSLDGVCLQVFLEHLKAAYPDDALLLVMDQASSHRSTRVTWPQDTQPLLLPSYSPQLNPAERCFQEAGSPGRARSAQDTAKNALQPPLRDAGNSAKCPNRCTSSFLAR